MRILKNLGRYDLCSGKKDWCVQILNLPENCPHRSINTSWQEDNEPEIEGLMPSEVIEIMSERIESFLYSSSREKDRETINWVRENSECLDSEWAKEMIDAKLRHIERLKQEIDDLQEIIIK